MGYATTCRRTAALQFLAYRHAMVLYADLRRAGRLFNDGMKASFIDEIGAGALVFGTGRRQAY